MKTCAKDVVGLMTQHPLFKNCSRAECDELCKVLKIRAKCFSENEMVVCEASEAKDVFVVCAGHLHLYTCGLADDSRHLVRSLVAGDTFGAGFPLMNFRQYPAMLLARAKGILLQVDIQAARRLVLAGKHSGFAANLYAESARQGYRDMRKLSLLSCYEIADRVLLYLRWRREDGHPEPVAVNYPELASYLGVNRTALYRAVSALKKAGKIRQVGMGIAAI